MKRDLLIAILIGMVAVCKGPFVKMTDFEQVIIAAGIGAIAYALMLTIKNEPV